MFDYTENNLYEVLCSTRIIYHSPPKEITEQCKTIIVDGVKMPIMHFDFRPTTRFTRYICLKTFLGYIPIERINGLRDIFNKANYITSEIDQVFSYQPMASSLEKREEVARLHLTLGKHFK